MDTNGLIAESQNIWTDKWRCDDAECDYQMSKHGVSKEVINNKNSPSSLVSEIAKARQHIQNSLRAEVCHQVDNVLVSRIEALELENKGFRQVTEDLQAVVKKLESRIAALEVGSGSVKTSAAPAPAKPAATKDDADDDFDLFGSDEDDDEAEKLKDERVKAYQDRKAKKPALIAKSNVILDVKPWDDETDMKELERCVRTVEMDGLLWGTSKLAEVGYGIKKLVISSVVEDDKVSMEDVEEKIMAFEDLVQSVDIAAFNKI